VTASVSPPSPPAPVDLEELAASQASCGDCSRARSSTALRVLAVKLERGTLLVDASSGVLRPLVPAAHRAAIFNAIYGLAHPGIRASRRLIASRFVWPNLVKDVAAWCKSCQQCQRAKVTVQPAAAAQPIPVPLARFSHVHVDLVGPLPRSNSGQAYLLTVVDRSTRWAEAIPLAGIAAEECAAAFISG
jgi:Integrase zinc binding domain